MKRTLAHTPEHVIVGARRIPRAAAWAWATEQRAEGRDVFHVHALNADMRGESQHVAAITWAALEREALAHYLAHAPGTRPDAWWWIVGRRYGLRRMVAGRGVPLAWSCRRGVPENIADREEPVAHESEAAYLQRHGLALPGELERVPAGGFDPVPWVHPVARSRA